MSAHDHHTLAAELFLRLADLRPGDRDAALRDEPDGPVRDAATAMLRGHSMPNGVLDGHPLGLLVIARLGAGRAAPPSPSAGLGGVEADA